MNGVAGFVVAECVACVWIFVVLVRFVSCYFNVLCSWLVLVSLWV